MATAAVREPVRRDPPPPLSPAREKLRALQAELARRLSYLDRYRIVNVKAAANKVAAARAQEDEAKQALEEARDRVERSGRATGSTAPLTAKANEAEAIRERAEAEQRTVEAEHVRLDQAQSDLHRPIEIAAIGPIEEIVEAKIAKAHALAKELGAIRQELGAFQALAARQLNVTRGQPHANQWNRLGRKCDDWSEVTIEAEPSDAQKRRAQGFYLHLIADASVEW